MKAIVSVSVATLHSKPDYESSVETQALMGYPVEVLQYGERWHRVRTIDGYEAYINSTNIAMPAEQWNEATKYIVTDFYTRLFSTPHSDSLPVCDLVAGNILSAHSSFSPSATHIPIVLPDGRQGYAPSTSIVKMSDWLNHCEPTAFNFLFTAQQFMGIPYSWGGASTKSVDCSGLLYMSALLNGVILPRNASAQANVGAQLNLSADKLKAGDFLFFGNENIPHVGIYLGNDEYLHSQGRVHVSSLNPERSDYVSHNHLLCATRPYDDQNILIAPTLCEALCLKSIGNKE